jgi:hypothetical protein
VPKMVTAVIVVSAHRNRSIVFRIVAQLTGRSAARV